MNKICEASKEVAAKYELSLGWEIPVTQRICLPDIHTVSGDIAADLCWSPSLIDKMADNRFKTILGKNKIIQRPLIPFKMKVSTASTADIRKSFTTDAMSPFKNYLNRRSIQREAQDSIKAVKNTYLSAPEKWLKYRLLSGTLEVRDKFFQGQRSMCRFCKEGPETTDHIFWSCTSLREILNSVSETLKEKFGVEIGREDFLASYRGEEESKVNAIITKVQQIIYAKRSSEDPDVATILPIFKLYTKVLQSF
eukprot:TRINITY_DN3252_c1_g1_i3.p1 TRINITY_DN3252_c1_g1~~TRINITY_DN3252_c1_g1_i3.p1  ORF type:complete len:252 (+),score=-1.90 TRINITY_DN3252_c1_g1_i3:109-864(+)